ncbi:MAG: FAD-dependent oxidoreductase [Oscillospiraceae bacterium]|jgi:2,4-dienoyl-CoA reductase-like NADH-dependent reductase (Old Yellow Enzyme family)/thioredoxin reductase|nr:FAD-dependent oxidoreductase [Oscillospiraceae bacterium]
MPQQNKFPHLLSPITLGSAVFKNRIFCAPTGWQDFGDAKCYPEANCVAYYSRKARGGAATVTVGEMMVDWKHGRGGPVNMPLDDPGAIGKLTLLTNGISRYGAVACAELQHAGAFADYSRDDGNKVFSPVARASVKGEVAHAGGGSVSDNVHGGEGAGDAVLEMTEDEIEYTIQKYAEAALNAKKAGFGMVLVHGGHGWLMSQFLSPHINNRRDKWGGSLENRVRFPIAVIERIHKLCGKGFPVDFRMSVTEANPDGYGMDEGVAIAEKLDGIADLIHCSAGHHEVQSAFVVTHPSMFLPDGTNLYLAEAVKKRVKNTPVATVGAFTDPAFCEEVIASGRADVIYLARELLADPDFAQKAIDGREDDVTKCVRCFTCFSNLLNTSQFCCAVNPEIGEEEEIRILPPVSRKKKVLVIGGGPAGMQAAITATKRGHEVTLIEKNARLGGALMCEESVPFKKKTAEYLSLMARRTKHGGTKVLTNTAFSEELAATESPDVIIAAIGAAPVVPAFIPGYNRANVYSAEQVYRDASLSGQTAVIIGGGLVGTELAIYLAQLGRAVTIVEALPTLTDGGNFLHGLALSVQLRENKVAVRTSTRVLAIEDGGPRVSPEDGAEELLPADTVIYAVGQKPLQLEAIEFAKCAPEFHIIGDCSAPKNIREATRSGYFTAANIGVN